MDDLFRFLLVRPATPVPPDGIDTLIASFAEQGTPRTEAIRAARAFLQGNAYPTSVGSLRYSSAAVAVGAALRKQCLPAGQVSSIVSGIAGMSAADIAADQFFISQNRLLRDSLVAFKLLSSSSGADAAGLAQIAQAFDAIARAAALPTETICLRALAVVDYPVGQQVPAGGTPTPKPVQKPDPRVDAARQALPRIEAALAALRSVSASDFAADHETTRPPAASDKSGVVGGQGRPSWMLTPKAAGALPADVRKLLAEHGLDAAKSALPVLFNSLDAIRTEQQVIIAVAEIPRGAIKNRFGNAIASISPSDYVGDPTGALPSGHGNVRPTGIGDLLLVREHVLRYEGGELAHVENVMKTEQLSRNTRRLDRTETTIVQETETTKEEDRDTQTTDRFSLKRETSDTIKTDSSLKAGVSVDAKYGPFVEVKANADFATTTSEEDSTQQASEFSRDVVDRSTSKLVERVLERRTTTTITEFEEKYSHGFDNTAGSGHVSGFYQWIDKVMQAQVYNYGRRLMFDVTVPEPGTNFILSQTNANAAAQPLQEPPPFTVTADQLFESNYLILAKLYETTGLEAPPPLVKTFGKSLDALTPQDPHETSKSDTIALDPGYTARYASFAFDYWSFANARWGMVIGTKQMEVITAAQLHVDLAGETVSLPIAWETHEVETFSATIEVLCDRNTTGLATWQLKTHAAITQAYLAKQQAYEQAVSQAQAAAESVIAGRNPAFNTQLVGMELRRQCLALVTDQQFDGFGALELSAEGYAQPNFDRTEVQMPYVRFFEQAFEWDHMLYFFYPYFWGWKPGWKNRMLLDDVDPAFADFLRAGAVRVVFPVRPGFETAVIHYLESGEIWNGGPPPDITNPLYVPIVQEIQDATGAPGNEQPVGDPWEIQLPTTLVRLRPNDDLPEWQKTDTGWTPAN